MHKHPRRTAANSHAYSVPNPAAHLDTDSNVEPYSDSYSYVHTHFNAYADCYGDLDTDTDSDPNPTPHPDTYSASDAFYQHQ